MKFYSTLLNPTISLCISLGMGQYEVLKVGKHWAKIVRLHRFYKDI